MGFQKGNTIGIGNKHRLGKEPWNKGQPHSEETKKKLSLSQKGQRHSPKTEFKKGQKHAPMTDATKEKLRAAAIKQHAEGRARHLQKGEYTPTEETRAKIRIARAKQVITPEHIAAIRKSHLSPVNRNFKNSGIELKIEAELKKRNIEYLKHHALCQIARVDFYLPQYNIIIECDGCYWHGCQIHYPKYRQNIRLRDIERTQAFELKGYKVYRFWEHEINKSSEECINRIIL